MCTAVKQTPARSLLPCGGFESPSLRHLTKQVIDIAYKTNKTDDLTVISDVRCVRTVRLGSPNTALLPYKMGGTLQRLFAARGMGSDPQRRKMGNAGPCDRDWESRTASKSDGGTVLEAKALSECRLFRSDKNHRRVSEEGPRRLNRKRPFTKENKPARY